jgi:hypothetical protein
MILIGAAELLFSIFFVNACVYPAALGFSLAACANGALGWSLVVMLLPLIFPAFAIFWTCLILGFAFIARPLQSTARCLALLKWGAIGAVATGLLVGGATAASGFHEKCNFGF